MRVVHVIPGVAARYGGPSQAIFNMCRALRAEGIETLIVSTDADGPTRLNVPLEQTFELDGVPAIIFRREMHEGFKYSGALARWLTRHVRDFDVVHIHAVFSHSSIAAARACRAAGVPYVVRPLGSLAQVNLRQKRLQKWLLWRLGVGAMLDGAAAIHYTTLGEQADAEDSAPVGRGVVVPLAVDERALALDLAAPIASFRDGLLAQGGYVLVMSRLHPKKGLELFLDAFLDATDAGGLHGWRLAIAGEGEPGYVARLHRMVADRRGEDRVLFLGWLDGADKATVLGSAALLAQPSHHENFGLSVVEALARGVPVLISPHVNLATEIVDAQAGWVAELDRGELTARLREILTDPSERAARGAAGRGLVLARYTWSAVAPQLASLYRTVSQRTHARAA